MFRTAFLVSSAVAAVKSVQKSPLALTALPGVLEFVLELELLTCVRPPLIGVVGAGRTSFRLVVMGVAAAAAADGCCSRACRVDSLLPLGVEAADDM